MATWEAVARIALAFPGVVEVRSATGLRSWRVTRGMLAWERPLRRADLEALGKAAPKGAILGVHVTDLNAKDALLAAKPELFFTTPHFDGYAAVLVRLSKIGPALLETLLRDAWLDHAPKRMTTKYLAATAPKPRLRRR